MANRYWRAGQTNWSSSASWNSDTIGPNGGASVPTVNDDVYFFDNATVSSGGGTCRTLYIGGVTVNWSSTIAMTIGASATAGTGHITIDGTLNHTGSATFLVYGDLQINSVYNQSTTGAGIITMSGSRDCNIYQGGGALNKLTISKSSSAVNVYLNSTLYVNYFKTSGNGILSHVQGHLRQQYNEIYCTVFAGSSGRQHEMSSNIVVFCTSSGATTISLVTPYTLSNREGSYITRGFTVATTVSMGSGTAAATAPRLIIEDNTTVTSSGNVYSLQCEGTMSGSLTVFTDFIGYNRNNNMPGFTLTYGVTAAGETRDFFWTGTIGALTFTPTNGSATQTGCTYNLNYARASGTITASSNSTNYYFNDVTWTSTAAQCNGSSSYYAFGNGTETKWTTGGLTCSGGASTYDFTNLNPTGVSTLNCAGSAVSGTGCTYNFGYVRGTAALAISCSGVTQNNFNVNNVVILGNFTFTVGTLNLISSYGEWLYVAGFNTSSGSVRTINFNDRRIVTSLAGAFDSTTVTNATFNRGGYDSGGVVLGGSGSSVFGAANTTQALRVWIERPGGTTTITSGNIRNLVLNNGTVIGTVNITVESISSETDTSVTSSNLNLTLSTTDGGYQNFNWTRSSFLSLSLTGAGSWTVQNLTASALTCSASNSAFYIGYPDGNGPGYCNITGGTGAVILSGSNNYFYLYYVAGKALTAQSGTGNYYNFELRSGTGLDGGFNTSMTIGSTSGAGAQYDLVYVYQTGYLNCAGTSGFSTYNFFDVRISNTSIGVRFITRGNFNLYGDLYTCKFDINGSDGSARVLNFTGDGSNTRNIYVSNASGTTMFDGANVGSLTITGRGTEDYGCIVVSDWYSAGTRGVVNGGTTSIAANGANLCSILWGCNENCTSITGAWYHIKSWQFPFTGGGVTGSSSITVYGHLLLGGIPTGGTSTTLWNGVSVTMVRSDGATQYFATGTDQGYSWQGFKIPSLTLNTNGLVQQAYYSQVNTLIITNGTIDVNGNQLYVLTSVTVTNNTNQKGIRLTGNDIYIAATTGAVWTCQDTNYVTCTGDGNVQVRGGTVNSGGTTRKYNDQVNFYLTGEAAYTLTSPFTCRNLTTNNYTPPGSWNLYVGGNLAWNWQNAWTIPAGAINFLATSASASISSNQGINLSYTFPLITVSNGTQLTVAGDVTCSTINCTSNGGFRLFLSRALVTTLLNIPSGSNLELTIGVLAFSASGGTQTTSGLYMAPGSTLSNLGGGIQYISAGEKYLTVPNNSTFSELRNSGAFNSGALTGYLNMYNSFTVDTITNDVNPSGFRQQTAGSTISVGAFSVSGTSGARAYWRNPATANMIKTTTGNVSVDYIDVAFSTVTGNGSGQLWYAGNNSVDSGNNVGWIFAAPATYALSITGGLTTIGEGNSFTVVLTTTGVSNGTNVAYTISGSGITTGDISGASLTGNFTVSSGTASVTFNVTADGVSEGSETFTLSLNNGQASISISITDATPTYSLFIVGSLSSVNEGSSFTVGLAVGNLPDGSTVPYTITGISSADISGASLTGNFTTAFSEASATFVVASDLLLEGPETFTLTLNGIGTNVSLLINDTSRPAGGDDFFMFFPI